MLEEHRTIAEVLGRYRGGPDTGVFTDGGSSPNPGPGGWGFVHVEKGKILHQGHGHSPDTTNNRMELTAIINALRSLPTDTDTVIFSDSNICVQTVNQWAANWEKRGWKRSGGPIANLELVQEMYALAKAHPKVKLQWVKAHNGWLWNEYADALATAWARTEL